MIEIELRVFGALRSYMTGMELGGYQVVKCEERSTVKDLLIMLGIPETEAKIIVINGRAKGIVDVLNNGDRLAIFPAVAGG